MSGAVQQDEKEQVTREELDELDMVSSASTEPEVTPDNLAQAADQGLPETTESGDQITEIRGDGDADTEKPPIDSATGTGAEEHGDKTAGTATPVLTIEELQKKLAEREAAEAAKTRALAEERTKNKELQALLAKQRPLTAPEIQPGETADVEDDDPEREAKQFAVQAIREERMKESEEALMDEIAEVGGEQSEYVQVIQQWFKPALGNDAALLRRFQRSMDPARFAFEEGKKIRDRVTKPVVSGDAVTKADLEKAIKEAEERGRQEIMEKVNKGAKLSQLPPSLSMVPGSAPQADKNALRKELDEL